MNTKEITKYCEQKLITDYGDELTLDSEFTRESDSWVYISKDQTSQLDALYVFPHTGLEIPDEFNSWYNLEDWQAVADSMLDNHDRGSRKVMSELIRDIKDADYNYGILFYKYTRVVTDANRLEYDEQMVNRPYRGVGIWNDKLDKAIVGKKTTDLWYKKVGEVVQAQNPKFIFHFHSMDVYGGGVASGGHEVSQGEKRPHAMVCKRYFFEARAYGAYGPDEALDFELMNGSQIAKVVELCKDSFAKFNDEQIEIGVDYPYKSPRMVSGFIRKFSQSPQLVIDFRKDLFERGVDEVVSLTHKLSKSLV